MKALSLNVFKKRFGLTQAEVNDLARHDKIQIQQNGYKGHVLEHHKVIAYPDDFVAPRPQWPFSNEPLPSQYQDAIVRNPKIPAVDRISITLRSDLIEEIRSIAEFDRCSPAELVQGWIREAAHKYWRNRQYIKFVEARTEEQARIG